MNTSVSAFFAMVLFAIASSVTYAEELPATQHFEKGVKLIEDNHYDAVGSTRAGMEAGVQHIKNALGLGYSDKKRAYLLLIGGYRQLQVYAEPGSDEANRLMMERNDYLQMLYQLSPNDVDVLGQYAELTTDKEEQLRAYHKVSKLQPKNARPHFVIAMSLIEAADLKGGVTELKTWLELEKNAAAVATYVRKAVDLLVEKGCVLPNQDTWFPKFLKIRLDLEAGTPSIREQAQVSFQRTKQEFRAALGRTSCHAPK